MGVSSSVAAAFVIMLVVSLMVNLASLTLDLEEKLAELLNRLTDRGCAQRRAHIGMDEAGDVVLFLDSGCGILLSDLARSDIYVYYRRAGGGSGLAHLLPTEDWWIVEVGMVDGGELINPSSPERWEGVLDPGEYALIRLRLPDDMEAGGAAYVMISLPDGEVLVGRR